MTLCLGSRVLFALSCTVTASYSARYCGVQNIYGLLVHKADVAEKGMAYSMTKHDMLTS